MLTIIYMHIGNREMHDYTIRTANNYAVSIIACYSINLILQIDDLICQNTL